MPFIIIGVVALFLLIYYRQYKMQIFYGVAGVFLLILIFAFNVDISTIIKAFLFVGIVYVIVKYLPGFAEQENEKKLKNYLETECEQLGQMDDNDWEKTLNQFKDSKMSRNYLDIAEEFTLANEKKYFTNNEDFTWIQVYIDYIDKNGRASIDQLLNVPNTYLNHTHYSHASFLIFDAIQLFNEMNRFGGYQMIDFEPVQNLSDVAQRFNCEIGETPKPYRYNLTLRDDYIKNYRGDDVKTNIDSEEISLDDLENM